MLELVARFHLNLVKRRKLETEIKNAERFIVKVYLSFVRRDCAVENVLILICSRSCSRNFISPRVYTRKLITYLMVAWQ